MTANPPQTPGIRRQAATGAAWSGASQAVRQAIQFVVTVTFLHLLASAEEYGLIGLALVFTNFLQIFREFGLGAAVIQEREVSDEQLSTIFWINVVTGAVLVAVTAGAAPAVAWWFEEPRLVWVTLALSPLFLFGALEILQRALLRKRLDFRAIAKVEIAATAVAGAVGVVLVVVWRDVRALVAQQLVLAFITAVGFFALSPWKPAWRFRWSSIHGMLGFSLNAFGSQVLGYFARNLDVFLIGTLLGAWAVGLYRAAYNLMLMPVRNISWTLGNVMFPVYASIRDDLPRMRRAYLRTVQSIALFSFPLMLGMMVLADPLVRCLASDEFNMTATLLVILTLAGMLQSVGTTVGSICYSQGRADRLLHLGLISVPVIAAGLAAGTPWDLVGVTTGYTVSQIGLWFLSHWMANSLIDLRMADFLRALLPILLAAAVMAGVVALLRLGLESYGMTNAWVLVGILVPAGALVYWVLIRSLRIGIVDELLEMMRDVLRDHLPQWRSKS